MIISLNSHAYETHCEHIRIRHIVDVENILYHAELNRFDSFVTFHWLVLANEFNSVSLGCAQIYGDQQISAGNWNSFRRKIPISN